MNNEVISNGVNLKLTKLFYNFCYIALVYLVGKCCPSDKSTSTKFAGMSVVEFTSIFYFTNWIQNVSHIFLYTQ